MMKATVWLACLLATLHLGLSAQEHSPLSLTAELRGGGALHALQFYQLPSHPVCCVTFTDTWSWTASLEIGAEYQTAMRLPGGPLSVGLMVGATMMPVALHEQQRGYNLIDGQDVREGVIGHDLELSYTAVTLRPYVAIPVASGLWAMAGMQAGVPVTTSIHQEEVLLGPEGYTFENGRRVRNEYNDALPDAAGLVVALDLALRYDLPLSPSITLSPMLRYQHPVTNITTAVPWAVSTLTAGAQLRWNLPVVKQEPKQEPKQVPPPPPPPPPPAVVQQPQVPLLQSSVVLTSTMPGARQVGSDAASELVIPAIDVRQTDTVRRVYPAIFFAAKSTEPIGPFSSILQAVRSYIVEHPEHRLTIVVGTSADEDRAIAKARLNAVLRDLPVDQNKVTILMESHGAGPYPELASEDRRIEFLVNDVLQPLTSLRTTEVEMIQPVELSAAHVLTCEAGPCTSQVEATADGQPLQASLERSVARLTVHRKALASARPVEVDVRITTTDTTGATSRASATTLLRIEERSRTIDTVICSAEESDMILGYFDFGSDTFRLIDTTVLRTAQDAMARGQRVQVLASTDALGAEDVNQRLRTRRAEAARTVLGMDRLTILVNTDRRPARTPLERIAQRSVRLRILADAD